MPGTLRAKSTFGSIAARTPTVGRGMRVGIMGGTFNPPHAGHRQVATTAMKRLGLDQVWLLVTPGNPLKQNGTLPPLEQRIALTARLAAHPRIRVSGFERELRSTYTVDTLAFLKRRHPDVRFIWIMGADGLAGFHRWRNWREIAALMPFVVVDRPGFRLRAAASPAAHALRRFFLPEEKARILPTSTAPTWTFLSTRLSPLSSTGLRSKSMI